MRHDRLAVASILVGASGEPGLPMLAFSASVAPVRVGEQVPRALMLASRGGRTAPGDQPLDGPLIVWLFDAVELSPAGGFVTRPRARCV